MARDETYNGWANRETWLVNLWLGNEPASYDRAREIAAQALADGREFNAEHGWPIEPNTGLGLVAEALESFVTVLVNDEYGSYTGMAGDLLNTALGRVDWMELARAWVEE